MQVKEIDINTGKIKWYGICNKKYKISILGGPTTPTYSKSFFVKYRDVHVPNLFSMVVRSKNRFCFLSSPIISSEGKILPPLNQKGPPLGWKIGKIVGCSASHLMCRLIWSGGGTASGHEPWWPRVGWMFYMYFQSHDYCLDEPNDGAALPPARLPGPPCH